MNISAWSIRNPVPAILLFLLLTAAGLLAFDRLSVQNFPDMDFPQITVTASLEGAAPSQLETEVARKIEDKLAALSRLEHITTTITDGSVSIQVTFEIGKDTDEALDEVRNAVDSASGDLPADMDSPQVSKVTVQSSPLLTYVVQSTKLDEMELSWFIDNDMNKAMLAVGGVGEVGRIGGVDREVHIDLDPTLMAALGVTASDVSSQLKSVQVNQSGGVGEIGNIRQTIRTLGAVDSIEDLSKMMIPLSSGLQVRLDQIATISDSFADRSSLAFRDGKPAIALQIKRANGYSDTGVVADIRKAVSSFAAAHPEVEITEAYNTVESIEENYASSMDMLYEGAALAVVVVLLFLRDWRATVLSAIALPLSIIPTFLVMYFADFSLNMISLLALSLVVGILVDDAIVEVENIARHLKMGKPPVQAAMEAADEIGLAVIATTFTLVAVFLPTAFMSGVPGLIFRQFGVTAAVSVLASLMVARFLTPMMAAYFMKPHHSEERDGLVMRLYLSVVRACLRFRYLTILGVAAFVVFSMAMIPYLKSGFFPAEDGGQTRVSITLAPGSRLADTEALSLRASNLIGRVADVRHVFTAVGTASSGQGMGETSTESVNTAELVVDLAPRDERSHSQSEVEEAIRTTLDQIPGARFEVGTGGNGTTLEIVLASDDSAALEQAATAVESDLRSLKGIGNVTSSAAMQAPEIQITPDFARAASLGVTSEAIAKVVRIATNGDYSSAMSKLNLPQRQLAIRVRFKSDVRDSLDAISQLRVAGTSGTVTLGSIADIRIGGAASEINRLDRSRNITLSVELNGRVIGDVMSEARSLPSLQNLPTGVELVEQGELQRMGELFTSFALAMAIGVFCIYAVLVLLFHDFLQPVTILMALPLSLGGALLPLVLTGTSFSMPAVIGLLMLMGVVSKNSILLVEYAVMARHRGMERFAALVDACHKRARPIVMTTIAMAAGMLPIALSLSGGDSSFRQPMAIVVIGGVITSTILSLLVIPVIFTFIDDLVRLLARLFGRKSTDVAPGPQAASS